MDSNIDVLNVVVLSKDYDKATEMLSEVDNINIITMDQYEEETKKPKRGFIGHILCAGLMMTDHRSCTLSIENDGMMLIGGDNFEDKLKNSLEKIRLNRPIVIDELPQLTYHTEVLRSRDRNRIHERGIQRVHSLKYKTGRL